MKDVGEGARWDRRRRCCLAAADIVAEVAAAAAAAADAAVVEIASTAPGAVMGDGPVRAVQGTPAGIGAAAEAGGNYYSPSPVVVSVVGDARRGSVRKSPWMKLVSIELGPAASAIDQSV